MDISASQLSFLVNTHNKILLPFPYNQVSSFTWKYLNTTMYYVHCYYEDPPNQPDKFIIVKYKVFTPPFIPVLMLLFPLQP